MKRRMGSAIAVMVGSLALFPALTHGAAATRSVAFHGTYKGTLTTGNGGGIRRSTGQASQLGKSKLYARDLQSGHYGGAGVGAVEGEGTLTAKGGSVLRYAYVTEFHIDGKTPSVGYYVFEGGTGRFYGASGTGTIRETPTGPAPTNPSPTELTQVTLVFQGTLNLVK